MFFLKKLQNMGNFNFEEELAHWQYFLKKS